MSGLFFSPVVDPARRLAGKTTVETLRQKAEKTAELLGLRPEQIPRHIAIIMDGNGRWARRRGLARFEGHREGARTVEKIVKCCVDFGIECLSLYSFSAQNWRRPKGEVDFLMSLYARYLVDMRPLLMRNNVRMVHLGRASELPEKVRTALAQTVRTTAGNGGMVLALALNYGARSEIVEAVREIAQRYKLGNIRLRDINEQLFSDCLYTAGLPEPDLLIRTSNEMRVSNFLLWQISYAEFYVTRRFWPDFGKKDLKRAIIAYSARRRRFGNVL